MKKYSTSIVGTHARKKLQAGAREVYRHVSKTLGPRGRTIVITKPHLTEILQDGVRVAEEINPEDKYENAGAQIIKQAARQQVGHVGDGTTVSIILSYSILSEALKMVESGVDPMMLKEGLERGRDLLIGEINKLSAPVRTQKQHIEVATISSKDKQMGQMIGEKLKEIGLDGVLTVEENKGFETYLDHQEGMQISTGYKHPYFVTNPRTQTATVNQAYVLVTDYTLDNIYDVEPMLDNVINKNGKKHLVFICQDATGDVLATMVTNKLQNKLQTLIVKAPSYKTATILQDIATMTGATFISQEAQMDLRTVTLDDFGYAQSVTSTKDTTVFVNGAGSKKAIKARTESIKAELAEAESEFDKEKLKERLAKMTGGVYVMYVGGSTEIETREKKERAYDAIEATRSAIRGGIVPGGEMVFAYILDILDPKTEGEEYAFRILKKALLKPFNILVKNGGMDSGQMRQKLEGRDFGYGINVVSGDVENLVEKGIIDPTEVPIEAIKNAISVTSAFMSEGIVAEEVED